MGHFAGNNQTFFTEMTSHLHLLHPTLCWGSTIPPQGKIHGEIDGKRAKSHFIHQKNHAKNGERNCRICPKREIEWSDSDMSTLEWRPNSRFI